VVYHAGLVELYGVYHKADVTSLQSIHVIYPQLFASSQLSVGISHSCAKQFTLFQLSFIAFHVHQSNTATFQSVDDAGHVTSHTQFCHQQKQSSSTYTGTSHACGVHDIFILLGFTFVAILNYLF
jgi:hypothetical protein